MTRPLDGWTPKLIASDMDGTLLRSDETVAPATLEQIRSWGEDGVPFVLATGRPPRWMLSIREVLGTGTAICCNGAVQLDLGRFEVRHEHTMGVDVLAARHRGSAARAAGHLVRRRVRPGVPARGGVPAALGPRRARRRGGEPGRRWWRRRWPSCWPGTRS